MSAGFAAAAAVARRIGADAEAAATGAMVARLAAAAPEITVVPVTGGLRLSEPGLVVRRFGSRRHGPDLQLLALLGGGR